jgi:type IV secretion system protein VirB10
VSEPDPIDPGVGGEQGIRGERAATAVLSARSVQSRVSNILALGLMSALGLGALTWYYASTMQRQSHVRRSAQAASTQRAQGDLPLPPLGKFEFPSTVAVGVTTSSVPAGGVATHSDGEVAPSAAVPIAPNLPSLSEAPPLYLPAQGAVAFGAGGTAAAVKTPAQLDLDRRLSGAAFATESPMPAALAPALEERPGSNGGADATAGVYPAASTGASPGAPAGAGEARSLAPLLLPGITAAVRAELLPTMRLLLPKGAFIDCTLETAIDSTLPGMTTCITATDTFGVDGKVVLLERGTKLVGEVRGQVEQGSARIFVLWDEARTPTGVIVSLASPGADELGRAGLSGAVDRHFWERFGAALLVSIIDGAVQAAVQSSNSGGGTVIYNPSGSQSVMTEVLKGTINIAPTVTKAQGDRIQVLVARDLDFRSVYDLRSNPGGR